MSDELEDPVEPRAELGARAPDALADGADPPMAAGEQRDDPVGLPQLLGAQHDTLVAVEAHVGILARRTDGRRHRTAGLRRFEP